MAKKNLVGIAKNRKPRKPTIKETEQPKVKVEEKKELSPEEERNLKAKAKVEELLHDSPIVNLDKKKEEKIEEPEEVIEAQEPKGVEWLEEQVQILSEQNEALVAELEMAKINGGGDSTEVTRAVIALFDELQQNHIKLGVNPQTGVGNFRIYCPGFLNRMIKFFPFLEEYKRY